MIKNTIVFYLSVVLLLTVLLLLKEKFNSVPGLMIDELFHVPQGTQYCRGKFENWDPKITTLPGLYVLTYLILAVFGNCSVSALRFVNLIGTLINYVLYVRLFHKEQGIDMKERIDGKCIWSALNLVFLPPAFFFTFLYYTDTWSMTMVLLMVNLAEGRKHSAAAVAGFFAILMRQTNVIWVIMVAANHACDILIRLKTNNMQTDRKIYYSHRELMACLEMTYRDGFNYFRIPKNVRVSFAMYVCVILGFIGFVILNGGIVVGDKSAHEATIHFPQLFYFALFIGVFGLPHLYSEIPSFVKFVCRRLYLIVLLGIVFCIIIAFNTMVHPYLLADNRHYTFYIWTRIYSANTFNPYLFVIGYIFVFYAMFRLVENRKVFLFFCTYIPCTMLVLMPQKLIDVRYFFIPYILLRLKFRMNVRHLIFESVHFLVLNYMTLQIFFTKEFYWAEFVEPQRIMW